MIVVVGQPILRVTGEDTVATGSAARIGTAAARRGSTVQLVGRVGEDPDGDALVLALTRAGVGHVALLRDPARTTPRLVEPAGDRSVEAAVTDDGASVAIEPADPALRPELDAADVELGLRYLTEFSVLVLTEPVDAAMGRVVSSAAGWANATTIALIDPATRAPGELPADAIVIEAPPLDPDGPFDILVGDLAAAIDAGTPADAAFRELIEAEGWQPAEA